MNSGNKALEEKTVGFYLECDHSTYRLREDGILEIQLKDEYYFTIDETKEITFNIIKVTHGVPHLTMVVAGSLTTCDDEARKYAATKEATNPIKALAIVTNSLGQTILANFFVQIQKPHIPTKIFNKIEKAEAYLKQVT